MISYNTKEWFTFIFRFHKSDTFRKLLPLMLIIGCYAGLICYMEMEYWKLKETSPVKNISLMHGMLGFVISLLLAYRTNTAYDRWWEGRKAWGAMVNDTRSLSSKLSVLKIDSEERKNFNDLIGLYVFSVKNHLRSQRVEQDADWQKDLSRLDLSGHQPLRIQQILRADIQKLYEHKTMSAECWLAVQRDLDALVASLGICERIKILAERCKKRPTALLSLSSGSNHFTLSIISS